MWDHNNENICDVDESDNPYEYFSDEEAKCYKWALFQEKDQSEGARKAKILAKFIKRFFRQ